MRNRAPKIKNTLRQGVNSGVDGPAVHFRSPRTLRWSSIDPTATLEEGVKVETVIHVGPKAEIGKSATLKRYRFPRLGAISIGGGAQIGKGTIIGGNVGKGTIVDPHESMTADHKKAHHGRVVVGEDGQDRYRRGPEDRTGKSFDELIEEIRESRPVTKE